MGEGWSAKGEIDGWQYRFRISPEHGRDVYSLVCTRYRQDGDSVMQHYLTTEGWRRFSNFDVLTDVPQVSGIEIVHDRGVEERIGKVMQDAIRGD